MTLPGILCGKNKNEHIDTIENEKKLCVPMCL